MTRAIKPRIISSLIIVFFLFSIEAIARDKWIISIPKDSVVVFKIPSAMFTFQKTSVWDGKNTYTANVTEGHAGSLLINGLEEWKDASWILMQEFAVKKVGKDKGKFYVEFRNEIVNVRLFFDMSSEKLNSAVNALVFNGTLGQFIATDYYQVEVVDRLLPKIFTGKLQNLPNAVKLGLLSGANFDHNVFGGEEFKGSFYLVIRSKDDTVYNTIRVNQAERAARTVEKFINEGVSKLGEFTDYPEINGIKIENQVFFKDFIQQQYSDASSERVDAYFLFDDLRKFKEADITNQELVDNSIVLVNGNRVKINLGQFN